MTNKTDPASANGNSSHSKPALQPRPAARSEPEEALPEALRQAANWYAAQPFPELVVADSQPLLARLGAEAARAAEAARGKEPRWRAGQSLRQTMRVVPWQLLLLGPWFWIAGAGLLLLSGLVLPALAPRDGLAALVCLLPLTAVLSVVYALRGTSRGLRELEVSCPTGFVETMAGVALAIVCFDSLLGVLGTAALALWQRAGFGSVLASWLGPLLLLVGLSFPVALRWGTLPGALVGAGPWLFILLAAATFPKVAAGPLVFVGQDGASLSAHLLAAALGALILAALWINGSAWQRRLVRP